MYDLITSPPLVSFALGFLVGAYLMMMITKRNKGDMAISRD